MTDPFGPGVCDFCEQEKPTLWDDGNGVTASCADCRTRRTGTVTEQFVYRDVVTEAVVAACPDVLHAEACAEVAERAVAELERLRVAVVDPAAVSPLDRAARWAHEMADVERVIDDNLGPDPAADPSVPLADQVEHALVYIEDRGRDEGDDLGHRAAQAAITPAVLARAVADVDGSRAVTDEDIAWASDVRDRLAANLRWTS